MEEVLEIRFDGAEKMSPNESGQALEAHFLSLEPSSGETQILQKVFHPSPCTTRYVHPNPTQAHHADIFCFISNLPRGYSWQETWLNRGSPSQNGTVDFSIVDRKGRGKRTKGKENHAGKEERARGKKFFWRTESRERKSILFPRFCLFIFPFTISTIIHHQSNPNRRNPSGGNFHSPPIKIVSTFHHLITLPSLQPPKLGRHSSSRVTSHRSGQIESRRIPLS